MLSRRETEWNDNIDGRLLLLTRSTRHTTHKNNTNRKGNPLEFQCTQVNFDLLYPINEVCWTSCWCRRCIDVICFVVCHWTSPCEPPGSSIFIFWRNKKQQHKNRWCMFPSQLELNNRFTCKSAVHPVALIISEFISDRKFIGGICINMTIWPWGHAKPWLIRFIIFSVLCTNVPSLSPKWVHYSFETICSLHFHYPIVWDYR